MPKTYTHETKWTTKNQTSRSFYGCPDKPTGITLHHWGVDEQRFDDVATFLSTNTVPTSAHYVVEDGRIATLALPEAATYHAGHTIGNGTTVGIELRPECTKGDVDTAVQLIYELEQTYGSMNIYQHKDWFATACAGRWGAKIPEIIERVNAMHKNGGKDPKLTAAPAPAPAPKPVAPKPAPVAPKPSAGSSTVKATPAPETLTYKNPSINGNRDVYQMITDIDRKLDRIIKQIGA